MRRPHLAALLTLLALLAAPAAACLWDNDTLLDERRGLPGVAAILAGKWERHSSFFYEHRVRKSRERIEKDPNDLAAYDDLAVALEKLNRPAEAIAVMLNKDRVKPGEYTTHANLGTFYLHTGDFENGVAHIRKALAINPDAHFGREKYKLMAAEYLLEAKRDPTVFDRGSFIFPQLVAAARPSMPTTQKALTYAEHLQGMTRYPRGLPDGFAGKTAAPLEGVVGMIRFGTGTSTHLYHALGDLLAARGDRHLASRAYRRALQYDHPRPQLLKQAIEYTESAVEHPTEFSPALLAKEQADAAAWVKAYQQYEDDLVRAGTDPATEADYAAFYQRHGHPRAAPPPAAGARNVMTKLFRIGAAGLALIALLIGLAVVKLWLVMTRRGKGRAAAVPPA